MPLLFLDDRSNGLDGRPASMERSGHAAIESSNSYRLLAPAC